MPKKLPLGSKIKIKPQYAGADDLAWRLSEKRTIGSKSREFTLFLERLLEHPEVAYVDDLASEGDKAIRPSEEALQVLKLFLQKKGVSGITYIPSANRIGSGSQEWSQAQAVRERLFDGILRRLNIEKVKPSTLDEFP